MVVIIYAVMLACFRCSDGGERVKSYVASAKGWKTRGKNAENAAQQICHFIAAQVHVTYFTPKSRDNRPIANMATISPKRGFSVATVAKGWSLVYMLMRVRYPVFSLWKQ